MLIALLLAGAQVTTDRLLAAVTLLRIAFLPLPGVTLLRIAFLPLPGLAFPEIMIHLQLLILYQVPEVQESSQVLPPPALPQVSDLFELCGKSRECFAVIRV